jgi:hypothetical protein
LLADFFNRKGRRFSRRQDRFLKVNDWLK